RSDISTQHLHGRQPAEKNLRILNRHFVSVFPALQSSTESRLEKLKPFRVFGLMLAVSECRFTTENSVAACPFFRTFAVRSMQFSRRQELPASEGRCFA